MAIEDFRRLLEQLRVALVATDAAGTITFANDAFAALVEAKAPDLPGKALPGLFGDDDRKRVQQNIARVGERKVASAFLEARLAAVRGARRLRRPGRQRAGAARGYAPAAAALVQDTRPPAGA